MEEKDNNAMVVSAYEVNEDIFTYTLVVTDKPSLCVVADKVVIHEFLESDLKKGITSNILSILFKLVTKDFTVQEELTETFLINKIMEESNMGVSSIFKQYSNFKTNILKVADMWERFLSGENMLGNCKLDTRYEHDNLFKLTVVDAVK